MRYVDISGLDKADVLARLYNRARTQGLGRLHYTPEDMPRQGAVGLIEERLASDEKPRHALRFDYLAGRVMKVNLSPRALFVGLYDRDNGDGAAAAALGLPMFDAESDEEAEAMVSRKGAEPHAGD